MFALLECVCEPTLSHQTASIKPLQKCGPYMPMAVLIRVNVIRNTIYSLADKASCCSASAIVGGQYAIVKAVLAQLPMTDLENCAKVLAYI